ncbi:MAG: MATE family efflux transporter [Pseudomonadota bacterium]
MARAAFDLGARRERLLTDPVPKVLFDLSWPMTWGLFSVIAINVTDTFYIGRLGADELSAIGFCFPVIFGMSAIAIGMGTGGSAVVSRAIGAGYLDQAQRLTASTMVFVGAFAAVLAAVMLQVSDKVFLALGAPEKLLPLINQFMTVWYWGLPTLVLPIVLNGLIRASGEAHFPSVLMVLAAVINAVVSPLVIFGLFGFPELGMKGAAFATVLARLVIMVIALIWLLRSKLIVFSRETAATFVPCIRQVLRYGAPAFFAQLVSPIGSAIATRLLAEAGPSAVAGFAVGARIEALALIPFFALQTGIAPFIGQNVGAGEDVRTREAERSVWIFAALWGGVGAVILYSFGESLAFLFTEDPMIAASTDAYLEAIALGLWGAGLLTSAMGIFSPLGYPNFGMAITMLRHLVLYAGLSLVLVMGFGVEAQRAVYSGAWISFAGAGLAAAFMAHHLLKKPRREHANDAVSKAPAAVKSSS